MDSHSDTARSRLNQILQDLAEKAEERTAEEEDALKLSQTENDVMPPPTTPSKKSGRAPRKRKRKETNTEDYVDSMRRKFHSKSLKILKLFDRSVDMAQFRKDTSMYVMCRAWTQNKPDTTYELGDKAKRSLEMPDYAVSEDTKFVYSLPAPVKEEVEDESVAVKQPENEANLDAAINKNSDIIALKASNVARWQKIRLSMREASLKKQERYLASLLQLKSLFTQP
eukprot:gene7202-8008_t